MNALFPKCGHTMSLEVYGKPGEADFFFTCRMPMRRFAPPATIAVCSTIRPPPRPPSLPTQQLQVQLSCEGHCRRECLFGVCMASSISTKCFVLIWLLMASSNGHAPPPL
mmetsp:Transcript_30230/g.92439  ORF Transcript_30230/g.92439 Transcript_30230/m.92439 type:complete len:110 (-) Transcript_30230:668-997(-)